MPRRTSSPGVTGGYSQHSRWPWQFSTGSENSPRINRGGARLSRITPTPLTALRPSPEAVPAAVSPPPADRRWRVDVGCGWPRSELRRQDFAGHADELVDRRVGQGVPLGAGRFVLVELLEQPAVGHRVRFVQAATWTSASRTLCPMSASLPAAPMMQSVLRRQKSDACDTPGCLI